MNSKNIIKLIPYLNFNSIFYFSSKKKDLYGIFHFILDILGVNKNATQN